MPGRSIELHPMAVAEARAALAWYQERDSAAARAFIDGLDHAMGVIDDAPSRWPAYLHGTRRYLLRRFPFFIVYRTRDDGVQVVAIAHARKRPGYWSDR